MPSAKKIVGNVATLVKTDAEIALEQSQKVIEDQKIEIEKLDKALKLYESENLRLREELEHAARVVSANSTKIGENERAKQKLKHQVASGEKNLRFEKIASEGLSKKVSIQGQELTEAKASLKTAQEERTYLRSRVLELEKGLSSGRSLRLKEMHENELFKRKITDLESRMLTAEEENRSAQSRLLDKIQELETSLAFNAAQQRTVDAQSEEMVALAREVCALREKQRVLLDKIAKLEHVAALCARERDAFESEVRRLRAPMLSDATGRVESMLQQLEWTGTGTGTGAATSVLKAIRSKATQAQLKSHPHPQQRTMGRKALASAAFTGARAISRPRVTAAESSLKDANAKPQGKGFDIDADADTSISPFIGATLLTSTSGRTTKQSSVLGDKKAVLLELSGSGSGHARAQDNQAQKHVFVQDDLQRHLDFSEDSDRNFSFDRNGDDHRDHDSHKRIVSDLKWATSPSSTPHRRALVKGASTFNNRGLSCPKEQVRPPKTTNETLAAAEMMSIPTGEEAQAGAPASPGPGLMMRSRSRFVGSGLGLRNDPAETDRFNPVGSAKAVLKKILSDFDG